MKLWGKGKRQDQETTENNSCLLKNISAPGCCTKWFPDAGGLEGPATWLLLFPGWPDSAYI